MFRHRNPRLWNPLDTLPLGGWLMVLIAVGSSAAVVLWSVPQRDGLELWTFATTHADTYRRILQRDASPPPHGTTPDHAPQEVHLLVIDNEALTRRTLSGFWVGTPLGDLIEIERSKIGQYVSGPLEDVGFVDLTQHLEAEGLMDLFNHASFAPWSVRGRIFGLPHDVHPVMLAYRADLAEAAGIDVSSIQTWDDFTRAFAPLLSDIDGDGRIDRFLLNAWYTDVGQLELLMLQAGGGTFDPQGQSLVASAPNVTVAAHVVLWCIGPNRICIDAPDFTASGNQLKIQGRVVAQLAPDWMCSTLRNDLPQLAGKMKLMPLPAWEPRGRRTSVRGGTMIGIPKATEDFEQSWAVAKRLYLSRELAEELFVVSRIVTPVKHLWNEPFYDEPDPYFSDQPAGRLYLELAPDVPFRSSHPFHSQAMTRIGDAVATLYDDARAGRLGPLEQLTPDQLRPRALQLLQHADERLQKEIRRNVFLSPATHTATE